MALNVNPEALEGLRTPFYYYDVDLFRRTVDEVAACAERYGIDVHYASKANCDSRLMSILAARGFGADCVSEGELRLALDAGVPADRIEFAGVGKSDREILEAIRAGIGSINVESVQELYIVNAIAGNYGLVANVSLRINPNIDAHTFRYVTSGLYANKFGIPSTEFEETAGMLSECANIRFKGLHFHIGSQIRDLENVFALVCDKANESIRWFESRGFKVENVNLGGGLGVNYEDPDAEPVPDFDSWFRIISERIDRSGGRRVHVEPGRAFVAQCATLVSRVLFVKDSGSKTFLVLDAGMNNMVRPAFYGAYHRIENISASLRPAIGETCVYDIVGPVCESSDTWGRDRRMALSVRGDLVAVRSAGAYGQAMQNFYNLRPAAQTVYSDRLDEAVRGEHII